MAGRRRNSSSRAMSWVKATGSNRPAWAASSDSAEASALAAELHLVLGALKRRLREHGDVADLTSAQKSVLLRLERDGPATGSTLARAEAMRPQSMGAIIAVLEAADVPVAPALADGDWLDHPQVRAMGLRTLVRNDAGDEVIMPGPFLGMSRTPVTLRWAAPTRHRPVAEVASRL